MHTIGSPVSASNRSYLNAEITQRLLSRQHNSARLILQP